MRTPRPRNARVARGAWSLLALACALAACDAGGDSGSGAADDGAELYLQVEGLVRGSCALLRCHGAVAGSGLDLLVPDLRQSLVDVPACEYPPMPRVTPGDPSRSWLMVKVAGSVREDLYLPFIVFEPEPGWDPTTRTASCDGVLPDGATWFGARMPGDGPALDADAIELLERWIAAGAPGPPPDHDASVGCLSILGCDGGS
jgi:hypothetical protein